MNNFVRDKNAEKELAGYLDQYFYPKFNRISNVRRIFSTKLQLEGIDVDAILDGERILIDEKGYLTANEPRSTFAFELSYKNSNGSRCQGWLFDEHKKTTHYLLCWNKRDENIGIEDVKLNDFHYIITMLISRVKFIEYLNSKYNITATTAQETVEYILQKNLGGRLDNLSGESNSRYHFSNQLDEEPINIVMTKEELLLSGAVDSHCLVRKKSGLKFL